MSHDQWNSVFCATHSRDHTTWKLTQFQKLDFDEHNTLSSLTENNLIGRGGSGTVYRITNNCSGELLAVKRICNNYRRLDHKVQKQFIAEVEILGTIRHSNIVKLCCISNESSSLLVWVHGEAEFGWMASWEEAEDIVHNFVLNWPTRLQIAIGAAKGLRHMHEYCSALIIHRDVKANNILLGANSTWKLRILDWPRCWSGKGSPTPCQKLQALADILPLVRPSRPSFPHIFISIMYGWFL